jgi:hypothetical protein
MNMKFYSSEKRQYPEARLQKAILQFLKLSGVEGLLWFHPANESKRSIVSGANLKALGMLPGVADLVIIRGGKAHFMEVKSLTGRLSDAQKDFAVLAVKAGAEWAVVHSIAEAITVLRDWQVIRKLAA